MSAKAEHNFNIFFKNENSYQSLINTVIYTHCKKFKEIIKSMSLYVYIHAYTHTDASFSK